MSVNVVNKTDGSLTQVAGTAGTIASNIIFDDTSSSLGSGNVQGAIDSLTTIVNTKQASTDNTLATTSKTVVGAINEINSNKQNATDNNLQTTDKTVVGAVNELKSGLMNEKASVDVTDGSGRNRFRMVLSDIKTNNTDGTWTDNVYVNNGVTFSIDTNTNGDIIGISVYGKKVDTTTTTVLKLSNNFEIADYSGNILTGCPNIGGEEYGYIQIQKNSGSYDTYARDSGSGATIPQANATCQVRIVIRNPFDISQSNAVVFRPMIRYGYITDTTYYPYIPSVESRIEAVESDLVTIDNMVIGTKTALAANTTTEISLPTGVLFLYVIWRDSITYAQLGLIVYNWQGTPSVIEIAKPDDAKFTVTGATDNKINVANTGNAGTLSLRRLDLGN